MLIYIGADHRGFRLKERLKRFLNGLGYEIVDKGAGAYNEKDDYPDFAAAVAREVATDPGNRRGILICGSGVGVDIVANKFPRVRSGIALSNDQVFAARHDDDINILSLAADFTLEEDAEKLAKTFLTTPFSGEERHKRRIKKIGELTENKVI
ncbi:MAG: RpiB/LacA/LacB family sugar-phosphate isomerase [Patescibacteria group bacterium]